MPPRISPLCTKRGVICKDDKTSNGNLGVTEAGSSMKHRPAVSTGRCDKKRGMHVEQRQGVAPLTTVDLGVAFKEM
jgi:hypothetical protein